MHREHLFRVLAEHPVCITFNTLSSGRSPSQCLECLVCPLGPTVLLSEPLSSTFHSCIPLGANLASLERCGGQHSHSCLFFFLITPVTFRAYFMSFPPLSFFLFLCCTSIFVSQFYLSGTYFCFLLVGRVGADGGWRLGVLLTRLCGFITRRKGGNTMTHFADSV